MLAGNDGSFTRALMVNTSALTVVIVGAVSIIGFDSSFAGIAGVVIPGSPDVMFRLADDLFTDDFRYC